jgi:hypothetical protein
MSMCKCAGIVGPMTVALQDIEESLWHEVGDHQCVGEHPSLHDSSSPHTPIVVLILTDTSPTDQASYIVVPTPPLPKPSLDPTKVLFPQHRHITPSILATPCTLVEYHVPLDKARALFNEGSPCFL